MRTLLPLACTGVLLAGPALAEQYWVGYEGEDFPENVGWQRELGNDYGGPVDEDDVGRWIDHGVFAVDNSLTWTFDSYSIHDPLEPEAAERFVATWRMRIIDQQQPGTLPGATVAIRTASDVPGNERAARFDYTLNSISSEREGWTAYFQPRRFHTYRFESDDMQNYWLWIDGQHVRTGVLESFGYSGPGVTFGDTFLGGGDGYTEWDYVRFGIVPQPPAVVLLCAGLIPWLLRRATR